MHTTLNVTFTCENCGRNSVVRNAQETMMFSYREDGSEYNSFERVSGMDFSVPCEHCGHENNFDVAIPS